MVSFRMTLSDIEGRSEIFDDTKHRCLRKLTCLIIHLVAFWIYFHTFWWVMHSPSPCGSAPTPRCFQLQLPLPSSETSFQCCVTASWLLVSAASRNHLFQRASYFHWINSTKRKVYCWLTWCGSENKISNDSTVIVVLESTRWVDKCYWTC